MKNKYSMPMILSLVAIAFELAFLYSAIGSGNQIVVGVMLLSLIIVCLVHGYTFRCWEMQRDFNKSYEQFIEMIAKSKALFERDSEDEQNKE